MAEARRFGFIPQSDIEKILSEAQHRWLRPAEICEILQNYKKFQISPEPPNKPPSGSLFLFDRKVLRYFRKDGHNWRKKKDGKTVKEAHERLKAGSVDVLHCYYAHGEEKENFQRRSYWMLEEEFMHIVLVHYLEVKGSKSSYTHSRDSEAAQAVHMDSPVCSNSFTSQSQLLSQVTGSPDTAHTLEHYDVESDNYQARSGYYSFSELQQYEYRPVMDVPLLDGFIPMPAVNTQCDHQRLQSRTPESDFYSVSQEDMTQVFDEKGLGLACGGSKQIDLSSWEAVLEHCTTGFQSTPLQPLAASAQAASLEENLKRRNLTLDELFDDDLGVKKDDDTVAQYKSVWQLSNDRVDSLIPANFDLENDLATESGINHSSLTKQPSLNISNIKDRLKKYDSFSSWMSKELGDVDDSHLNTSSALHWTPYESEAIVGPSMFSQGHLDAYSMSPSLAQEQLFSISDFSPNWAYTNSETRVHIAGTFFKNKLNVEKGKYSCMFGEVEVPVEILTDGSLSCNAPSHKSGMVPFYLTCSDRLACSEVREFEFRDTHAHARYMDTSDNSSLSEMNLHIRLENLFSLESYGKAKPVSSSSCGKPHLSTELSSLMIEADDEWSDTLKVTCERGTPESAKDHLPQNLLKEKLQAWLVQIAAKDAKGPCVLDKEGQGAIHLAASLGYDWALKPMILAGVNINFRDTGGWTSLHWAAFCGRERTVASLLALNADPGAITDPTPKFPSGRTAADLAYVNGHKGIAGFLAESSLTSHLSALTLKNAGIRDLAELSSLKPVEGIVKRSVIQLTHEDMQSGHSLEDSLNAVRNAAQAASRIYQVFRVHSFYRRKHTEYDADKCGISDDCALSLISFKTSRRGHAMPLHAAAIRIQNKFRGWKGRKEFLVIRQRIVKIQAHVRGHQARTQYKKFVWSVGIVEKVILRWRRKGSGLRGFRPEGLLEGTTMQIQPSKDDDFLQEGRKQTEARLEKALARVNSMVQYPEARDQYQRLLTVVMELQKSKDFQERLMNESEDAVDTDLMIEELLDDDTFIPNAVWH